jgi:hypothetical protein
VSATPTTEEVPLLFPLDAEEPPVGCRDVGAARKTPPLPLPMPPPPPPPPPPPRDGKLFASSMFGASGADGAKREAAVAPCAGC